jgi:hypothetical protein
MDPVPGRLNGHDAHAYDPYVLGRLPAQPASRIDELLRHRWRPTQSRMPRPSSRRVRRTLTQFGWARCHVCFEASNPAG